MFFCARVYKILSHISHLCIDDWLPHRVNLLSVYANEICVAYNNKERKKKREFLTLKFIIMIRDVHTQKTICIPVANLIYFYLNQNDWKEDEKSASAIDMQERETRVRWRMREINFQCQRVGALCVYNNHIQHELFAVSVSFNNCLWLLLLSFFLFLSLSLFLHLLTH